MLALDIGLTAVKAVAFAPDGRLRAFARGFWDRPWVPAGAVPQTAAKDVPDPWPLAARVLAEAVRGLDPGERVAALAVSCAAHQGACVDADGQFFTLPSPGPEDAAALARDPRWGPGGLLRFGYGGALARVVRHAVDTAPDAVARARHVGPLHAYAVWRLTGRWATDPASGPGEAAWPLVWPELAGVDAGALPDLLPSEAVAGGLGASAAAAVGLPRGTPVAVGSLDGVCASFGADAYRVGDCALTLSTNFVPRPVVAAPIPGCFGYAVRPGGWAWVNGVSLCGRQIDLAAAALGAADGPGRERLSAAALAHLTSGAPRPDLPWLGVADVPAQGGRVRRAVAAGYAPAAVYLAVIEGCAAALAGRLRQAAADGATARRYVATGGLARSDVVVRAVERAIGAPVGAAHPEAAAVGAAAFAAAAAGWRRSAEAALGDLLAGGAN